MGVHPSATFDQHDCQPNPGKRTEPSRSRGEGTSTARVQVPATATQTASPPPTAAPEIVPGFGVVVWLGAFGLLVVLLILRRRD